ncbi:MAG: hypothetical protein QXH40_00775 [Candidatus Bathyarchaeia archaeon]
MKTNYKKMLKFATLLISSLLIATASAGVVRYMEIQGTVQISAGGLAWVKGADEPGISVNIDGQIATVSLSLNNGTAYNITNHLYLKNLDNDKNYTVTIEVTDPPSSELYEAFNIVIYHNMTNAQITSINALSPSPASNTIHQGEVWHITFYIDTKSSASGSDSFTVKFTYEQV